MESEVKKIRVCFVSPKAYPLFNPACPAVFGGAEVDLYLLATELAKDPQFEVSFVVGDYGQPKTEQRQGVTLLKSLDVDKNMIFYGWKVWQALRRADADVYMHEACSLGTALIALFCGIYRRSFVYRTASSQEADGTYFRQKPLRGWWVRRAFRKADAFIVQNEQDARRALATVGRSARVIRNACRIRPAAATDKNGGLWVGRSDPVKRPDLFLKLAAAFPDIPFTMVCQQGHGDNRYPELVRQAGQIGNLTFVKRVAFGDIDSYFERAAAFVNTSDSEGFPNTFVQAAKAATPILSLTVNPDEFLTRHACGVCADGNWERFCRMLSDLTETPRGREWGQNGREYIKAHHDLQVIIEEYKRIFLQTAH
ncbi:MAG: glycosyltransferase family 4 protein [Planctomycetales bacterium]|nr:glycosyltransferase family 4 protein [Planctomycetales bacterium]